MKCNYCWRKASWSMKSMLYGNTFYKFICTYHFIEETLSLEEILKIEKYFVIKTFQIKNASNNT